MLQTRSLIPTARRRGFTLIELLISVGLLSLLLVLIGQLFQQSSTAVSTSVRTGAVIANARSVSSQMDDDFQNLLGPSSDVNEAGGFIVIINQAIPLVSFPEPRNGGEYVQSYIRSDHIAFISNAPGNKPISPRNSDTYGNDIDGSDYTRITYGHAQRTNRNGSPRTGADTDLGQANAELDRLGTELILGRHALVFAPPPTVPGVNDVAATDRYAAAWRTSSPITNHGSTGVPNPRMYHGMTDVTVASYFGTTGPKLYNYLRTRDIAGTSDPDYIETTFVNNRLQVNPAPTQSVGDNESWRIAQTHGIFSPNCSEFVVQFAGDLDNDGELDTGDNGTPTDPSDDFIIWYDAFNGNLGASPYSAFTDPNGNATYFPGADPFAGDPSVFIFRVGDTGSTTAGDPANSKWPVLIRVRYRLHDARGRVTSNDPAAFNDGIDQDGDGIDVPGTPAFDDDEDQISGRWFEHIYRVPRPALPTP